jgi:hypothetical protein
MLKPVEQTKYLSFIVGVYIGAAVFTVGYTTLLVIDKYRNIRKNIQRFPFDKAQETKW